MEGVGMDIGTLIIVSTLFSKPPIVYSYALFPCGFDELEYIG